MAGKQTGVVAKWLNHKGIGFITPDGSEGGEGLDILVHFEQIKQSSEDGFKSLEQGSKVAFDLEVDPKNPEKKVAINVTGPDGEDCIPRQKGAGKGGKGKGKGKKGKGKGKKGKGKGKKGKGKGKGDDDEEEEE